LFLEFGFGHGENIIKLSVNRPHWVFIAIDPFLNGVASLLEKIKTKKISNIYIYHGDGRSFLKELPKNSISETCILFPDPWPKLKHESRRLIQKEFLNKLSEVMVSNSFVYTSSDNHIAQTWTLKTFLYNKNFEWIVKDINQIYKKPDFFEDTKYFKKSLKEGRQVSWLKFKNVKEY
jgi:tRNA (guanine-N7-)-methyltransferase